MGTVSYSLNLVLFLILSFSAPLASTFERLPSLLKKPQPLSTNYLISTRNVHRKQEIKGRNNHAVALFVEPAVIIGGLAVIGGGVVWVGGAEDRGKKSMYADWEREDRLRREERARLAYIEPREGGKGTWTLEELSQYTGEDDEDGPILLAASGKVYNVWKGRNFYGQGGEYHVLAGRDATRLLAKTRLEEETEDELKVPLNIGERAALETWLWTFKNKYEVVGRLEGYNPKDTEM